MNTIKVIKVNDECTSKAKYTLLKNGEFYTGNISNWLANQYIKKFLTKGFTIL